MLSGNTVYLGNPEPVRDLLYIEDHINGYMKIIEAPTVPRTVNLCTGIGTSIKELTENLADLTEFTGKIVWGKTMKRPTEIDILIGDNTLAKDMLGWTPKVDLRTGLKYTVDKIRRVVK
jgi:nucleoside-diphosphate-sugar epimerase